MNSIARGSVVVGTLADDRQAHKTLGDLHHAGFETAQTGLAVKTEDLIVQTDALARADVADRGLVAALVSMGVPRKDATNYEREFAASRAVVTVQTVDRLTEAAQILRRNRAHEVHRW
jgi:hypothetical protein